MKGSLFLWNPVTKKDIQPIAEGQNLASVPEVNGLRVAFSELPAGKNVRSVRFRVNGVANPKVERLVPWCLGGDEFPLGLKAGNWKIEADAFSQPDGKTGLIGTVTMTFSIAKFVLGMVTHTSAGGFPYAQQDALFASFKNKWLRVWITPDWNKPLSLSGFKRHAALAAAGMKIVACCTTPIVPEAGQAAKWFDDSCEALGKTFAAWEIGNEPDLRPKYYQGSFADYMAKNLKPAYSVLSKRGALVIGGSTSEQPQEVQSLVNMGLLDNCDIVGYHPYGSTASEQIKRCLQTRGIVGDSKPIWLTEWNIHGGKDYGRWASQLPGLLAGIRPLVNGAFYYRSVVSGQYAGVAGILKASMKVNEPFYSIVKEMFLANAA